MMTRDDYDRANNTVHRATTNYPDRSLQRGDAVQVFDTQRNIWIDAVIVGVWYVTTFNGMPPEAEYEVEGEDDIGKFTGRWEAKFVRASGKLPLAPRKGPLDP